VLLCAVLAERMHGGLRGLLAKLWASVLGLSVLCAVQGDTALIKAAAQGDEALLNQLIAVEANVCAENVIYCSCACVSHQSNDHLITLLKILPPN
jgi:hypothetical protein